MLDFYDAELRAHHEHLRAAYGIAPGDEVLDIGCGAGLTTREAGHASASGRVVGVDVSEPMLRRARELTAAEALDNVSYVLGDAQRQAFEPGRFDVAISRFGLMFFSDPDAALANIASALRPGARLAALVWQPRERNAWAAAIATALGDVPEPPPSVPDPFSLGDAAATARLLERAGFEAVRLEDVDEPVFYGHDVDAVLDVVRGFAGTRAALETMSPDDADQAIGRLRATLEDHHDDDQGVVFAARSWLVTARRR
jgi:SAM-dependent methyltransferase